MPEDLSSAVPIFYMRFRALYVGLGILGVLLMWRRPRAAMALGLVLGLNLAAWAAYVAPLRRLYGLGEGRDRAFNVGMAACTAASGRPWDFVQVRQAAVEPFWNTLVAALALFRPGSVLPAYEWLAPLSIVAVALGLYFGLRTGDDEADAWERVLIVLAVLGLSSWSTSQRPPVPLLWAGNFLLKPNHAAAWGLVGVAIGLRARGGGAVRLGLALGLLAWVFLLEWPFVALGLLLGTWLKPRAERDWHRTAAALGVSMLVALPDILNFARDYLPTAGGIAKGVWRQPLLGPLLALPQWSVLDLAPLAMLGGAGALVLRSRAGPRDRALLGLLAAAAVTTVAYGVGGFAGLSPGPDEAHYFLRFVLSLSAGAALATAARSLEAARGLVPGQGHLLALGVCVPLSFPAYFDPPTMDRYYSSNRQAIPKSVLAYGAWVRENTGPGSVFAAGPSASTWIPVLAGRRVLLSGAARPPADYEARKAAERTILTSRDPAAVSRAAREWGITHVAVDPALLEEYGPPLAAALEASTTLEPAYRSSAVTILRVRAP